MTRRCIIYVLLYLAAVTCPLSIAVAQENSAETETLTPLPIELPQPSFSGTPLDYFSSYLEPPSFRKRAPFLAPQGAVNVALNKTVTASMETPQSGKLSQIVDGKKQFEQPFIVELPQGVQWIQIDLGADYMVYAIVVWHFHEYDRVYFDVVVKTALDKEFTSGVITQYNNDYDNSIGLGVGEDKEYVESFQGRLMDAKGARSRYVRLYSNGNTSNAFNQYIEVEVWGKACK